MYVKVAQINLYYSVCRNLVIFRDHAFYMRVHWSLYVDIVLGLFMTYCWYSILG